MLNVINFRYDATRMSRMYLNFPTGNVIRYSCLLVCLTDYLQDYPELCVCNAAEQCYMYFNQQINSFMALETGCDCAEHCVWLNRLPLAIGTECFWKYNWIRFQCRLHFMPWELDQAKIGLSVNQKESQLGQK